MSTSIPRHILVAHDFSETAERALFFAVDLASALDARVTVVHAYEIYPFGYAETVGLTTEFVDDIERDARTGLEEVAARVRRPGVEVRSLLRKGLPWLEINASARECRADLIVTGTHGRRGFSHALLGSVAEKVVRTAPCPVLTVRGPAGARGS
jgi:nucleotide-binding universal stress UspA family protein